MKEMLRARAPRLYDALSDTRQRVRDRWFRTTDTVVTPSGILVEIRGFADRCMYHDIFLGGEYDPAISLALRTPEPDPLIVDLGANVGYFGLRVADLWLQLRGPAAPFTIVGVEGSPQVYADLQRRLRQPLLAGHCEYHLGLAGRRAGHGRMSSEAYHFKRAVLDDDQARRARHAPRVAYVDLESLVPPDRRIALLKSNIEGAEGPVIREYPELLSRVDVAVIQFHHDRCDVDNAVRRLAAAGLGVWQRRERGPAGQSSWIFVNESRVPVA